MTSGTLTGSITFNNEATCNITIDVAEPTPTGGFDPISLDKIMISQDNANFEFTLSTGSYDGSTEYVTFNYYIDDTSAFGEVISVSGRIIEYDPEVYKVQVESDNQFGDDLYGSVVLKAFVHNTASDELVREYTATINLTILGNHT